MPSSVDAARTAQAITATRRTLPWLLVASAMALSGCGTIGQATRTSAVLYQPTSSAHVQILFEKPTRPYDIVGQVGSKGGPLASEDALYRAMQKEAAEIGAHAIWVGGLNEGITTQQEGNHQRSRSLALRWKDGIMSPTPFAVTPTSIRPTTPRETQVIPRNVGRY